MDHTQGGSSAYNGNLPLAQQQQQQQSPLDSSYIYNSYLGQQMPPASARSAANGTAVSPMAMVQSSVAGPAAGPRPMSMYDSPVPSMYPTLAGPPDSSQQQQQQQMVGASDMRTTDGSFHAIMIGDNSQQGAANAARAPLPPIGVSGNGTQAIPLRQKQSYAAMSSDSAAGRVDVYGGSLSASLPSGNPFLQGAMSGVAGAAAVSPAGGAQHGTAGDYSYANMTGHPTFGYAHNGQGGDWTASVQSPSANQKFGISQQQSQHQQSSMHMYSSAPQSAATHEGSEMSHQLYHTIRQNQSQQNSPRISDHVYQTVSVAGAVHAGNGISANAQMYPVSQPGLPPLHTASSGLAAYATSGQPPLSTRGRSRRRPHQTFDHLEPNSAGTYSSESSPAPGSLQAPVMRQTMSSVVTSDSINSPAEQVSPGHAGSEFNASMNSMRGSSSSDHGAMGNYSPGSSKYNYPDMSYKPANATHGPASASMSQMSIENDEYSGSAVEHVNGNYSPSDGQNYPEYASAATSTAHMRWNPAVRGSPLRTELNSAGMAAMSQANTPKTEGAPLDSPGITHMSSIRFPGAGAGAGSSAVSYSREQQQHQQQQMAQLYATLPRAGYNGNMPTMSSAGASRGQIPVSLASRPTGSGGSTGINTTGINQDSWPPASPHIGVSASGSAQNGGAYMHQRNPSYGSQTNPAAAIDTTGSVQAATPSILKDYYVVYSPADRSYNDPSTPRADSTSILPMVEANQGSSRPPAGNMDDFNAHSQEYLHRRRRRLTQTMHNRQRSGSAVDANARHSIVTGVRGNAIPISSPGSNSLTSNRSAEEATTQHGSETDTHQLQQQQQHPISSSYTGGPSGYLTADTQSIMLAQAQAQVQAQVQANARSQADYINSLQHNHAQKEHLMQERLYQERMRMAHERQQQQQERLKLAREQEIARFQNFRPLLSLTVDLVDTYRKCHPEFYYESAQRPRRVLTHPSEGVENDGFDNENSDYILYVNDIIGDKEGHQYLILEMLGSGTFGQVVKCQNIKTGKYSAVKVIKNKPAYSKQSMMEVRMLDMLNTKYDTNDQHHILRLEEWFEFRNHLIFVNELLSINLYDLLKQNQYQGLSTNLVRILVQQILDAMIVLNEAQIIHADLKPENILLEEINKPQVKVIDFGSACLEWETSFSYIQSRFYRSPEIIMGLRYSSRIDMWSLGCIVAELYLGLPLFPGASEYNQLSRIIDLLGMPPTSMIESAKRKDDFFNYLGKGNWAFKPMAQYSLENNVEEKPSKRYFTATTLSELITTYPVRRKMNDIEQQHEYQMRIALIDFLRGLLEMDPNKRWSPQQAMMHPFITGEPFNGPYNPAHHISGGIHGPGSAPGPYGGAGGSSGGAGGSNYGHPSSGGYQMQGNAGSGGGLGSMTTTGRRVSGYQGTAVGRDPGAHGMYMYNDAGQSIPGAFPANDSSNTQSYQSSYAGSHTSRTDTNGGSRNRATTIGHSASGAPGTQNHQQQHDFLDVDPCTSLINGLLAAGSMSQDVPGRLHVSQGGNEYFAGSTYNCAFRADSSTGNGGGGGSNPLSLAGSYSTMASSIYDYKTAAATAAAAAVGAGISASIATSSVASGASSLLSATSNSQQLYPRQHAYTERQARLFQQIDSTSQPFSDGYISSDPIPLPQTMNNAADRSNTSTERISFYSGMSSDISHHGTPGPVTDVATSDGTVARASGAGVAAAGAAMSSANFMNLSYTDSSAASSVVGGSRPGGGFSSVRIRPSPALRSSAGARLVSNLSPLTLSSTPGSFNNSARQQMLRQGSGTDVDEFSDIEEATTGSDFSDVGDGDEENVYSRDSYESMYSITSEMSRPMTQPAGSDKSLSMYSAHGSDGSSGSYLSSIRDAGAGSVGDRDNSRWDDGMSDMRSDDFSDSGDYADAWSMPLLVDRSANAAKMYQQHQTSNSSLSIRAVGAGVYAHGSSLFSHGGGNPQELYAHSYSDSAFMASGYSSSELDFIEFRAEDGDDSQTGNDDDDDGIGVGNDIETGSVISQEDRREYQGALTPEDIASRTSFLGRLDLERLSASSRLFEHLSDSTDMDEDSEGSATNPDSDENDGIEFSAMSRSKVVSVKQANSEAPSDSDVDIDGKTQQDTILFTGKLHPKSGPGVETGVISAVANALQRRQSSACVSEAASATLPERLGQSPALASRGHFPPSSAEYPQRVMKKSQLQRRGEKPLQLKDNLRMVESLRRMGKWQDTAWTSPALSEINRANQFYLDPVIICMSPRLVPQQPSGQQG
ncbi:dual specificity protein kinase yak1 [Coemansia interrupta]|uniref:Dual specificity protein kinase yak1 n=1 Tax=Coemansia interrupta TaxID=1126814 RepID=A0A9W8HSA0_9FUNG|nr:dual specificity protein kinase yak1 [Coemansia interrupta]